jgi:hypothetical protein
VRQENPHHTSHGIISRPTWVCMMQKNGFSLCRSFAFPEIATLKRSLFFQGHVSVLEKQTTASLAKQEMLTTRHLIKMSKMNGKICGDYKHWFMKRCVYLPHWQY